MRKPLIELTKAQIRIQNLTDTEKLENAITYINKLYNEKIINENTDNYYDVEHWSTMHEIVKCPKYDLPF